LNDLAIVLAELIIFLLITWFIHEAEKWRDRAYQLGYKKEKKK